MVAEGKILRYDEERGYGFIVPSDGGDDVFVHANAFGSRRHFVRPGMRVAYEAEPGDRGPKVSSIRILDQLPAKLPPGERLPDEDDRRFAAAGDDGRWGDGPWGDGGSLTSREYVTEVTELLLRQSPTLTAAQVLEIRSGLVEHATAHGWLAD